MSTQDGNNNGRIVRNTWCSSPCTKPTMKQVRSRYRYLCKITEHEKAFSRARTRGRIENRKRSSSTYSFSKLCSVLMNPTMFIQWVNLIITLLRLEISPPNALLLCTGGRFCPGCQFQETDLNCNMVPPRLGFLCRNLQFFRDQYPDGGLKENKNSSTCQPNNNWTDFSSCVSFEEWCLYHHHHHSRSKHDRPFL